MAKNKLERKKIKNLFAVGLLTSNILLVSGCGEVPCDVTDNHAHLYVTENDFNIYLINEKETIYKEHDGFATRTDEYKVVTEEEAKLLKIIDKEGLYRIDENMDVINAITAGHHDYTEYEYRYLGIRAVHSGNNTYYMNVPRYAWTVNSERGNLTGNTRDCHYVYYGCRLIEEEHTNVFGKKTIKYVVIKSDPVDDISLLPDGYEYIEKDFYDIVDSKDHSKIYHTCENGNPIIEMEEKAAENIKEERVR